MAKTRSSVISVAVLGDASSLVRAFGQAEKAGQKWNANVSDGWKKAGKFAAGAVAAVVGIGTAIAGVAIKGGIDRALNIENAQAKLRGLGHDTQTIERVMESALASVKGTAFGLDEAAGAAAAAMAAGVPAGEELTRVLSLVGDTSTITGRQFGEAGAIINKVLAGNRLSMEEVNQLSDAGLPILSMLADQYGVTALAMRDMVSQGKIDSRAFLEALETNIGGAALESGETTQGAFRNMRAALSRFGETLIRDVFPLAKTVFTGIGTAVDGLSKRLGPVLERLGESEWFRALAGHLERIPEYFDRAVAAAEGFWDRWGATFGDLGSAAGHLVSIAGSIVDIADGIASIGETEDDPGFLKSLFDYSDTFRILGEDIEYATETLDMYFANMAEGAGPSKDAADLTRDLSSELVEEQRQRREAARQSAAYEDQTIETTGAVEDQTSALIAHEEALAALIDPTFNVIRSVRDHEKAVEDTAAALDEFGAESPEYEAALMDQAEAGAALRLAYAQLKENGIDPTRQALTETLTAYGLTKDEADRLVDSLATLEGMKLGDKTFRIRVDAPAFTYEQNGNRIKPVSTGMVAMARGGIATGPTAALIGEAGDDEAVIPLNGRGVSVLAAALAEALKLGGSGRLQSPTPPPAVINITVQSLDPAAAGRAVVEALQSYERMNGSLPLSVRRAS